MPKVTDEPIGLKPFKFLGLEVEHDGYSTQARGDCPFCGKENKFHANVQTAQWDCKSCGAEGNVYTLFKKLHELSIEETTDGQYRTLSLDRKVRVDTLKAWGVCKSSVGGEWLIPGYSPEGKLTQLYRYVPDGKGAMKCMLTPGPSGIGEDGTLGHALFGVHLLTSDAKTIYVCEGVFDGMALWEALGSYKQGAGKLVATANRHISLIANAGVVSVPSASSFKDTWAKLFEGRIVKLAYDSDYPRQAESKAGNHESNGKINGHAHPLLSGHGAKNANPGPGLAGMKRAVRSISRWEKAPERVDYLRWGPEGYDPSKPDGWDVRDHLNCEPKRRGGMLEELLGKFVPIPSEWLHNLAGKAGSTELKPEKCESWQKLLNAWKKAAKMTPAIRRALAVSLACVVSTEQPTDQLWVKIMGPPSSFKTTICEALAVAKRYVKSVSKIKGFHSGYRTDAEGAEDHSLIKQIKNKTLAIKDADTLLQSTNLGEILSEMRDVYDRSSRAEYRTGTKREYENLNITVMLFGTSSLRQLDASELGDRFLNCVIMDRIDPVLEQEVNLRIINRMRHQMGKGKGGEDKNDQAMQKARALTGGYVEYLRGKQPDGTLTADHLMNMVEMDDRAAAMCSLMGTFVAYMRARPSTKQDEEAQREFSARLVSQLGKLAFCLAVVLNKEMIDDEVLGHVVKVAMDTARGKTLQITHKLNRYGQKGMTTKALAMEVNEPEDKLRHYLRFLRRIEAVQLYDGVEHFGEGCMPHYRLSKPLTEVYGEVMKNVKRLTALEK